LNALSIQTLRNHIAVSEKKKANNKIGIKAKGKYSVNIIIYMLPKGIATHWLLFNQAAIIPI
jgi:hypothetical protein